MRRALARAAMLACAVALAGCASFSADGGFGRVTQLTKERTGHAPAWQRGAAPDPAVQARMDELLAQPLSADGAVEFALLAQPGLQARFAELGVAEAELVRAGRLRNPVLGLGRLAGGGALEIDRSLMFDLLGLLTMPAARQAGEQQFERAQLQAAQDAVGVAAEARRSWILAVAAAQQLAYESQVKETADIAAELARRMVKAGNFSRLDQLRERAYYADADAQLARSQLQAQAARERLARALGWAGDPQRIRLPGRLPDLPAAPAPAGDAEQTAMTHRLDLLIARRHAEALAASLGLTTSTRYVDALQAGVQNKSSRDAPTLSGAQLELELPLFDGGGARVAQAEARYRQALQQTAQLALNARSEVRESYAAYRAAWEQARHWRDELLPLRKAIVDESLLRYNGMLGSVFDLLADAREQSLAVGSTIQALRDFWLADAELQNAITGGASTAPQDPNPS